MGLDEDDEDMVLFIQSNKGDNVYCLNKEELSVSDLMKVMFVDDESFDSREFHERNPFKISDVNDDNMDIIVSYMRHCAINGEKNSPPKPLPVDTLPNILGTDYEFFRSILESQQSDQEKIVKIASLIMDITYFQIIKFQEKACATMAYFFIGKSITEIKTMVKYAEEIHT